MSERETWYVLEDGTNADPKDCTFADGWPVHNDGRRVAAKMPDVPHTRGIDPDVERAKAEDRAKREADEKAQAESAAKANAGKARPDVEKSKDLQPEAPKPGYKTRETKSK